MSWHKHINKGTAALVRADYETASSELKRALNQAHNEFSDGDRRTLDTLILLGQAHFKNGNYKEAEPLFIELAQQCNGGHSMTTAAALISLAQINKHSGKTADAYKRYQEALGVLGNASDGQKEDSVAALEDLLRTVASQTYNCTHENFRDLLRSALQGSSQGAKQKDFAPPGDIRLLQQWENCMKSGNQYLAGDSPAETVAAYNNSLQAVKGAYRLFAHDDNRVAAALNLLAQSSQKVLMHDQAEALYKRAADIYAKDPQMQAELAQVKFNLACFYQSIHDYRQALTTVVEAAEPASQDADSEGQADFYSLALSLMAKADLYSAARDLIRQAIECEESDRLEQANLHYDNTLALMRRVFGDQHPEVAQMMHFKANLLRRLGDAGGANQFEKQAQQIEADYDAQLEIHQRYANKLQPFRIPPSRCLPQP